jgi:hypothetical protein
VKLLYHGIAPDGCTSGAMVKPMQAADNPSIPHMGRLRQTRAALSFVRCAKMVNESKKPDDLNVHVSDSLTAFDPSEFERRMIRSILGRVLEPKPNDPDQCQHDPPGRPSDLLYDTAFEKIRNGELKQGKARAWFFEQAHITRIDKGAKDAFNQAMRRRRNRLRNKA